MSPLDAIFRYWPALVVAVVAALIPRGEDKARERVGLAAVAGFLALGVQVLWPSGAGVEAPQRPRPSGRTCSTSSSSSRSRAPSPSCSSRARPSASSAASRSASWRSPSPPRSSLLTVPMTAGWHFQYIHPWIPALGIRYHVAIDGISLWLVLLTTFVHPDRRVRGLRVHQDADQGAVLLVPAPAGRDDRRLRLARPLPLLRVLGGGPHPDVRDDRGLGRGRPHPRGGQVLPLHDDRLDADARGHRLPGVDVPEAHRTVDVRLPRALARRAARASGARVHVAAGHLPAGPVLLGVRHRLLHQGPDVAGAHLAAGRPRPGAHGRLGHPRRRDAQAGHLRLPPLRDGPLPGDGVALLRQPRGHRHPGRHRVRRARGLEAGRREAPRRLLVGRAPRLRHARALHRHGGGASRAPSCR